MTYLITPPLYRDAGHSDPTGLARSGEGAARHASGVAAQPPCAAAEPAEVAQAGATAHRLMHLSDLHFGAHDPQVCAAVQRLAQWLQVSVVVVSGDLTQRATRPQFAMAHEFVTGLGVAQRVVLAGNHDLPLFAWWLRWGRAYDRFAAQFGAQLEPRRQAGPFSVVGVNTTRPWRHERGSLSVNQVEQVAADLLAAPNDAWRIVVSHHPLVARSAADRSHRPHLADMAVQRWHEAGAHMLLSGHVHEPGLLQPLPGLWSMQAGTAVSYRLRHGQPNSLVVLQMRPCLQGTQTQTQAPERPDQAPAWQRLAQRWDYDARSGDFVCVESCSVVG